MEEKSTYRVFWSVTELAKEARVTTGAIRQLLLAGSLEGVKIGKQWAIPDSKAQEYIQKKRSKNKPG